MELQELQGQERFRATQAGKLEKLYEAPSGLGLRLSIRVRRVSISLGGFLEVLERLIYV